MFDGDLLSNLLQSLAVFVALIGAALVGFQLRRRLPESHRDRETLEFIQIVRGMLVTFVAIVLGLLITSVKTSYETTAHLTAGYMYDLARLDQCLRTYGAETDPLRRKLQSYTAGMIASTWTQEAPPAGVPYPNASDVGRAEASPTLGRLLDEIHVGLLKLQLGDAIRANVAADCSDDFRTIMAARGALNGDEHSELSIPFYGLLIGWLVIIFVSFGLLSPANSTVMIAVALCAFVLTSILFTLLELDQPYAGMFYVSSTEARQTLEQMLAP